MHNIHYERHFLYFIESFKYIRIKTFSAECSPQWMPLITFEPSLLIQINCFKVSKKDICNLTNYSCMLSNSSSSDII